MSYSVYIKYRSKRYKLPVNPEEIKKKQKLNIEKYQVLGSGQVSVPTYQALNEYNFECELPHHEMHYMEPGSRADPDWYIRMLTKAQKEKTPVRLIYSNGMTDDESVMVLVESCEILEKSGEEGDKYLALSETVKEIPRGCDTGSDGGPARDTAANEPGSGGRKDIYCAERRFPLEDRKTVLWEWGAVFENRKCERG